MADLQSTVVPCGWAGLDTDSAPEAILDGLAPEHKNFLLHHEKEMRIRGPLVSHSTLAIGSNVQVTGIWNFGNKALVGLMAADATAVREPWVAPYKNASSAAPLAEPNTTMKLIDFDAMTVSNVTAAQGTTIMGRGERIGNSVYGFAYSGTTDDNTGTNGYVHQRSLLRWDGTTTAPTAVANAVDSGQDVKTHLNRLFALGGRDVPGGLSTHEFNTLYWTDPGGPVHSTAADWQDDVSGLTNKIVIDADNPNDFGVGLVKVGGTLAILKRRSLHVLSGYSSDTFTLRTFSSDIGCVDARTIVEHDDGCYFLSAEGYMYFDGSVLENVSKRISTELVSNVAQTVGTNGVDGGRAFASKLPNHYILLTIMNQTPSTGVIGSVAQSYLFHAPTRRWSRYHSLATANTIPVASGRTSEVPFLIDGTNAVRLDYLTNPDATSAANRGLDVVAGTTRRIPAKWKSAMINFSTPLYMSQIHRILVDYTFRLNSGGDNANDAWYVSLYEGTGRELQAAYQLDAMGSATTYLYRRRHVQDNFFEVSDAQLVVEWYEDGSWPAVADGRIYDCFVEYKTSRQRRAT